MQYYPNLAIMTGILEIGAAVWVLRGPGRAEIKRPVGAILFLLAAYQILEAMLCQVGGTSFLNRIAFADITWLPAIGVLLVQRLSGDKGRRLSAIFLTSAGALTVWVLLDPLFVSRAVCKAVIAIYSHPGPFYAVYATYYQLGLMTMMMGAGFAMAKSEDPVMRRHLADVQVGTMAFVLPSMITELVFSSAAGSQPSLMCHYAVFLAIFLVRLTLREQALVTDCAPKSLRTSAA